LLLILSTCTFALAQSENNEFNQFMGDWQGEGHFYNVDFSNEVGMVRFTLRITPDMEILGTIGDAEIRDAEIEVDDWNDGYMIKGTVDGRIFPENDFKKKRITLLLKAVQDNTTIGDFHLANNFIFDFSMRPGEITLRRIP